jgi:hypothetical protein
MLTRAVPPANELPISAGILAVATQPPAWVIVADAFRLWSTGVSFVTTILEREPGAVNREPSDSRWSLRPGFAAITASVRRADGTVAVPDLPVPRSAPVRWLNDGSGWGVGTIWWFSPRLEGLVTIDWKWRERGVAVQFDVTLPLLE